MQKDQEGADRRDALGNKGRVSGTGNTEMQGGHHVQIQKDIQHRGEDQQIQRNPRFTESIEHGREDVVHKQKGQAVKVNV